MAEGSDITTGLDYSINHRAVLTKGKSGELKVNCINS